MNHKDSGFHDYVVHDLLGTFESITSRAMFGGWGIYQYGVIFAIIVDGELFMKARDDANAVYFKDHGSRQFSYSTPKHPKSIQMSYWSVPEEVLENTDSLGEWVQRATRVSKN